MKKALSVSIMIVAILSIFAFAQDTGGMLDEMSGGMSGGISGGM